MNTQDCQNIDNENVHATSEIMPLLFLGHGSPMNAIKDNKYTQAWKEMVKGLNPKGVLIISAHWQTRGSYIFAGEYNPMIYDFSGFPEELFKVKYAAPSNQALADQISLINPDIQLSKDWGIDHGAWSIMNQIFPSAEIPVIQLSLNQNLSMKEHWNLAEQLKYLRNEGILIIGSGNIVHNLQKMNKYHERNLLFQNHVLEIIKKKEYTKLINLDKTSDFPYAHPTNEHFLPLIYVVSLANSEESAQILTPDLLWGSISMANIKIGRC